MLWTLVQKEIKNNLLSLRFVLATIVEQVIVLGSLYIRLDDYLQSALDYRANVDGAMDQIDLSLQAFAEARSAFERSGTLIGSGRLATPVSPTTWHWMS